MTPTDDDFPPTLEAAYRRLAAVRPADYARSRNAIHGAVTRLSPYFTHGLLDLPAALAAVTQRYPLGPEDKLVMEFGWREFFQHVWRHLGEGILRDIRPPIRSQPYAQVLPADVRSASSGVPVIDQAVRTLYATGYLHNHARMWLASYLVHQRKLHWRVGADWMYGHLLDGDLASNHLSWQWVAGTFSSKPYLFNAENVARYAPAEWHSPGTVIDTDYAELEERARHGGDCGPEAHRPEPVEEPPLLAEPPLSPSVLPTSLPEQVRLVHPWSLGEVDPADYCLGWIDPRFHRRFPWSARRWRFVLERMQTVCAAVHIGDGRELLERLRGSSLIARDTAHPGYAEVLRSGAVNLQPVPRFLPDPEQLRPSFSRFYGERMPRRRGWHKV